jgi:hypothetical protein
MTIRSALLVTIACTALFTTGARSRVVAQQSEVLQLLTPPQGVLPATCKLRPALGKGDLYGHNPAIVTDTASLSIVHMFATAKGMIAERPVAAGYTASYREEGGSPRIDVYALRFTRELTTAQADTFKNNRYVGGANALRRVNGSVAILAYSNARPDAPDKGCYDALRKHLETVDVK